MIQQGEFMLSEEYPHYQEKKWKESRAASDKFF
jgi:hypothetical protein